MWAANEIISVEENFQRSKKNNNKCIDKKWKAMHSGQFSNRTKQTCSTSVRLGSNGRNAAATTFTLTYTLPKNSSVKSTKFWRNWTAS